MLPSKWDPTWTLFASTCGILTLSVFAPFLENALGTQLFKREFLKLSLGPLQGNAGALSSKPRLKTLYLKRRSFSGSVRTFISGLPGLPWCSGIAWAVLQSQLKPLSAIFLLFLTWGSRYAWDLLKSDNWRSVVMWRQEVGSLPMKVVSRHFVKEEVFSQLCRRLIQDARSLHTHSLTTCLWIVWLFVLIESRSPLFPYLCFLVAIRFVLELVWKWTHLRETLKLSSPRSDFQSKTVEGRLFWLWNRSGNFFQKLWPLASSSWDPFLAVLILGLH